jgi:hypothetical protein
MTELDTTLGAPIAQFVLDFGTPENWKTLDDRCRDIATPVDLSSAVTRATGGGVALRERIRLAASDGGTLKTSAEQKMRSDAWAGATWSLNDRYAAVIKLKQTDIAAYVIANRTLANDWISAASNYSDVPNAVASATNQTFVLIDLGNIARFNLLDPTSAVNLYNDSLRAALKVKGASIDLAVFTLGDTLRFDLADGRGALAVYRRALSTQLDPSEQAWLLAEVSALESSPIKPDPTDARCAILQGLVLWSQMYRDSDPVMKELLGGESNDATAAAGLTRLEGMPPSAVRMLAGAKLWLPFRARSDVAAYLSRNDPARFLTSCLTRNLAAAHR